ncbi:MAG: HNH endonuclease family protein [Candidatus Saccharibacteria bacterium]|nr:HNH endonuclease family protein [Candidatus Saccharibacteria bacterium]
MTNVYRRRRAVLIFCISICIMLIGVINQLGENKSVEQQNKKVQTTSNQQLAVDALDSLDVKGRAPKTGYARDMFGNGWRKSGDCNTRDDVLARDMTQLDIRDCKVYAGILDDPYTGKTIRFLRGPGTSSLVQIDHVVALSNSWQTGSQYLDSETRENLANDPLELLAVDGKANQDKSDGDAATWLPPNKSYRCRYVARQIAVKQKYNLWVTSAERDAIKRVLSICPGQVLPTVTG